MSTEAKSSNEKLEDLAIAEEASPISSRPPAAATAASSSSRWPRQETLALLQIRSEMDAAFRDAATLKAPLWEYVSRKLEEQGYKRSAKKCKEKFENVHKYYKRTKEGQVGRQDGKSYKFFTQLDALHQNTNLSTANTNIVPILPPTTNPAATFSLLSQDQPQAPTSHDHHTINITDHQPPVSLHAAAPAGAAIGISFSSSSSQREGDEEDEEEEEEEMESAQHRKRKRSHGNDSDQRMMEFFEGLMRQVMQKQEAMQQRFLEAIEKREQDRMIREEAWKRQDMARLGREQELMSQERAISASRDAAILAFLQKITGQTIHLPTTVARDPAPPPFLPQELQQQQQQQQPNFQPQKQSQNQNRWQLHEQNPQEAPSSQNIKVTVWHQPNTSNSEVVTAMPEQPVTSREATSSRWPKVEVLALIQLRSGLESRYQEAVPKGPLWEDISAGMRRMGFNRNAKRCKEKWENINKYFKKVKESNKKRPEDAKTCPYFHELDALYHKKILGNTGNAGGSSSGDILGSWPENESQNKDGGGNSELQTSSTLGVTASSLSREQSHMGSIEGAKQQPEDIVRKQHQERYEKLDYNFCDDSSSDKENEEDNDEDEVYDFDENEEEMKLAYNTQFKTRQSIGSDSISIYHNHGSVRGQPASIAN